MPSGPARSVVRRRSGADGLAILAVLDSVRKPGLHARARQLLVPFVLSALGGCVSPAGGPPDGPVGCAGNEDLERIAAAERVFVSAPRPVPGYPSLGTDRVLAAFDPQTLGAYERSDWLQRLRDAGARRAYLLRATLESRGIDVPAQATSPACRRTDAGAESGVDPDWQHLAAAVQVGDDYLDSRRVLGLYPLAALPVRLGIGGLQRDIAQTFATPLDALPRLGTLQRYAPTATIPGPALSVPPAARDTLGVRVAGLPREQLERLFDRHAPVLEVDVAGAFDRPGAPFFDAAGTVSVATEAPRAYRYARVMPLDDELRLQLVYVFWFAERPRRDAFDMLGGRLDGLVWRVTLDDAGEPLVYDAMHPCGCYHMLFPSSRLALRDGARERPEPPLVPQAAPRLAADERVVLRLASGTHYLQRVYSSAAAKDGAAPAVQRYVQRPYRELYRAASPRGGRSLFGPEGIVPGTQRGERFYLWPMGVRSPGAMRERGRQATAFIGRRHFDDARLLEDLFELTP